MSKSTKGEMSIQEFWNSCTMAPGDILNIVKDLAEALEGERRHEDGDGIGVREGAEGLVVEIPRQQDLGEQGESRRGDGAEPDGPGLSPQGHAGKGSGPVGFGPVQVASMIVEGSVGPRYPETVS
jgi:hypothetical protein